MKKVAGIALACLALLLTHALAVFAGDPYYPYQTYEEYYKKQSEPPSELAPPPSQPSLEGEPKPPPRTEPITIATPPEFLFPPELGFGVAVGVPYDLFYLSGAYYFLRAGTWYRSSSYRGPWKVQGLSRLPPELRKHKLAQIHEYRAREFKSFWENKKNYKGRYFRPDIEAPAKKRQDPR